MFGIEKCFYREGNLHPCYEWRDIIHFPHTSNNQTKGFRWTTKRNPKTWKDIIELIHYHHTRTHRGILLKYCPFCGEKFNTEFEEKKSEDVKE